MPLFKKRMNSTPAQTATFGDTLEFNIGREFHIEGFYIEVTGVVSASATGDVASYQAADLLANVTVSTNDGQNQRNVVSASGSALMHYHFNEQGNVDPETRRSIWNGLSTTGGFSAHIPIFFAPPQMSDPTRSAFLLPAPRFNTDPVVRVQIANLLDLDTNGVLAFSSLSVRVHTIRQVVNIGSWVTYDQELKEVRQGFAAIGTDQIHELDVPGSYSGIGMIPRSTVSQNQISGGNIGDVTLQALDTTMRKLPYNTMEAIAGGSFVGSELNGPNQGGLVDQGFAPNRVDGVFMDFLTDGIGSPVRELGSLLDANPYVATGTRIKILQDIIGACTVGYTARRFFGDLAPLKFNTGGRS